jgi:hypothetical protein
MTILILKFFNPSLSKNRQCRAGFHFIREKNKKKGGILPNENNGEQRDENHVEIENKGKGREKY